MSRVNSTGCVHVQAIVLPSRKLHVLIEGQNYEEQAQADWRFCPVCGKEIQFRATNEGDDNGY